MTLFFSTEYRLSEEHLAAQSAAAKGTAAPTTTSIAKSGSFSTIFSRFPARDFTRGDIPRMAFAIREFAPGAASHSVDFQARTGVRKRMGKLTEENNSSNNKGRGVDTCFNLLETVE